MALRLIFILLAGKILFTPTSNKWDAPTNAGANMWYDCAEAETSLLFDANIRNISTKTNFSHKKNGYKRICKDFPGAA